VSLSDVRLERVSGWAKFIAVRTGKASRAEMLGLNMIVDSGGIAGGVITIRTAIQPAPAP
jgi:hypothetical protein